ncbi:MAG: Rrf2 family transcriptional regulator [Phycisphaerales bacterium]|jgi:Rrf2 family protein|nr:Rrf2 family transcriptional regulator [Phycisphaerales bacterium]
MLALTKKTGYALIAMGQLSQLDGETLASARELAGSLNVSTSLLMNVLKQLASAGYIESVRGAHGGYRMAIKPGEVSLADLVGVLEGPVKLSECVMEVTGEDGQCTCQVMASCPVTDPVHRVQRKLHDFLTSVTLDEIVQPAPVLTEHKG